MITLICGCRSSVDNSNSTNNNTNQQQETIDDNTIVFDTPLLAVDDDNVTIEILSLYVESYNYDREPNEYGYIQYGINCRETNKNEDYYVKTNIPDGYASVGDHTVDFASGDANIRPGKTNDGVNFCTTRFNDGNGDSRGVEYIEKLVDLLGFDAELSIALYTDTDTAHVVCKEYKVPVSIPELNATQN